MVGECKNYSFLNCCIYLKLLYLSFLLTYNLCVRRRHVIGAPSRHVALRTNVDVSVDVLPLPVKCRRLNFEGLKG